MKYTQEQLRDIDCQVEEHVFRVKIRSLSAVPRYTKEVMSAWWIADRLIKDGIYFEILPPSQQTGRDGWLITGYCANDGQRYSSAEGFAETLPLAISLAALKARGIAP